MVHRQPQHASPFKHIFYSCSFNDANRLNDVQSFRFQFNYILEQSYLRHFLLDQKSWTSFSLSYFPHLQLNLSKNSKVSNFSYRCISKVASCLQLILVFRIRLRVIDLLAGSLWFAIDKPLMHADNSTKLSNEKKKINVIQMSR